MSLATILEALSADLSRNLPRSTASFAETRARRPELAPFETAADLRRALDPTSRALDAEARRALVTALVEEAQTGASPLWSSLLVVAFAPMLHRIRKSVTAAIDPDLDSAVVAAFLGAVRAIRPGPYSTLALRWATEKEVLLARIAERRLGPRATFNENVHSDAAAQLHETETRRTIDDVLRVLEAEGAAEILDVLIATRGRDESLRAYVVRTCPNPRERGARYEHLCRARLRFERELRERVTARAA